MNCLFLLVLLSCCNGFGSGRNSGCGCSGNESGQRGEGRSRDNRSESDQRGEGCGRDNRSESGQRGEGRSRDNRSESGQRGEGCGCESRNERRNESRMEGEGCGCDGRYPDSRMMSRYDDSMRGYAFGDSVPEMRQQGRM